MGLCFGLMQSSIAAEKLYYPDLYVKDGLTEIDVMLASANIMIAEMYAEADIDSVVLGAEEGYKAAQYELGERYRSGIDVVQNHIKSSDWYLKAAKQGHTEAEFAIGTNYYNGTGVRQDYSKAIQWLQKAAEKKDPYAQFNLGLAYLDGYGVRLNKTTAKEWFGKSCDNGYQLGCDKYRELN